MNQIEQTEEIFRVFSGRMNKTIKQAVNLIRIAIDWSKEENPVPLVKEFCRKCKMNGLLAANFVDLARLARDNPGRFNEVISRFIGDKDMKAEILFPLESIKGGVTIDLITHGIKARALLSKEINQTNLNLFTKGEEIERQHDDFAFGNATALGLVIQIDFLSRLTPKKLREILSSFPDHRNPLSISVSGIETMVYASFTDPKNHGEYPNSRFYDWLVGYSSSYRKEIEEGEAPFLKRLDNFSVLCDICFGREIVLRVREETFRLELIYATLRGIFKTLVE